MAFKWNCHLVLNPGLHYFFNTMQQEMDSFYSLSSNHGWVIQSMLRTWRKPPLLRQGFIELTRNKRLASAGQVGMPPREQGQLHNTPSPGYSSSVESHRKHVWCWKHVWGEGHFGTHLYICSNRCLRIHVTYLKPKDWQEPTSWAMLFLKY